MLQSDPHAEPKCQPLVRTCCVAAFLRVRKIVIINGVSSRKFQGLDQCDFVSFIQYNSFFFLLVFRSSFSFLLFSFAGDLLMVEFRNFS